MCGIIPANSAMQLPHFLSVKKAGKLSRRDEKVFTEASRLALLRLEQCIADLRIPAPAMKGLTKTYAHSATERRYQSHQGASLSSTGCQYVSPPALNSRTMPESNEDIVNSLRASSGRPMRIRFSDGIVQTVIIGTLDNEGFLHCCVGTADAQMFWTRFQDVHALEAPN